MVLGILLKSPIFGRVQRGDEPDGALPVGADGAVAGAVLAAAAADRAAAAARAAAPARRRLTAGALLNLYHRVQGDEPVVLRLKFNLARFFYDDVLSS